LAANAAAAPRANAASANTTGRRSILRGRRGISAANANTARARHVTFPNIHARERYNDPDLFNYPTVRSRLNTALVTGKIPKHIYNIEMKAAKNRLHMHTKKRGFAFHTNNVNKIVVPHLSEHAAEIAQRNAAHELWPYRANFAYRNAFLNASERARHTNPNTAEHAVLAKNNPELNALLSRSIRYNLTRRATERLTGITRRKIMIQNRMDILLAHMTTYKRRTNAHEKTIRVLITIVNELHNMFMETNQLTLEAIHRTNFNELAGVHLANGEPSLKKHLSAELITMHDFLNQQMVQFIACLELLKQIPYDVYADNRIQKMFDMLQRSVFSKLMEIDPNLKKMIPVKIEELLQRMT
jgi:hypothetical protein